jgi:hypothetical protein
MMAKPTVFIHTNPNQLLGAKVAEFSFQEMSPNRDKFEVKIINLVDYPHLTKRQGQTYLRKGQIVTWQNRDLQSFSPLRFLPPQLMNYQGRAIVVDPDVFAVADIYELLSRDMGGKSILSRHVQPPNGRPDFYASSVMLLDCEKLRHWQWDQRIDEMFEHAWDYGQWISLKQEPEGTIGNLEPEWNDFDTLTPATKLLHNTERSTQPWKTGLPVDFNLNYKKANASTRGPNAFFKELSYLLGLKQRPKPTPVPGIPSDAKYQPHPDPNQEAFFFSLVKKGLDAGAISEEFLRSEIQKQHLRPDVFACLDRVAQQRQMSRFEHQIS